MKAQHKNLYQIINCESEIENDFYNLSEKSSLNSKALENPMQATIKMKVFMFLFVSKQKKFK